MPAQPTEESDMITAEPPVTDFQPKNRSHRPLYLKRIPVSLWQQIHIAAIEQQLPLQDYIIRLLTAGGSIQDSTNLRDSQEEPCHNPLNSTTENSLDP